MAFVCFTYDVNFRDLVEEHELSVGEDMNETVRFELVDASYNF